MYIFVHGIDSANHEALSHDFENHALRETSFLIPSSIVRYNLEQRVESLNHWHNRLYWHGRKLGTKFDDPLKSDPAKLDYGTLSKDLNAANARLAYAIWACKATARQLDFMDSAAKRYREQSIRHELPEDQANEIEAMLVETHVHLRVWNKGILDRAEYLSERGQALVQTVTVGSPNAIHTSACLSQLLVRN